MKKELWKMLKKLLLSLQSARLAFRMTWKQLGRPLNPQQKANLMEAYLQQQMRGMCHRERMHLLESQLQMIQRLQYHQNKKRWESHPSTGHRSFERSGEDYPQVSRPK
jgi:hypothetical protein